MKHPALALLAAACAALLMPLCGCAQDPDATSTPNPKDTDPMNPQSKTLVAVFSATGTTKGVAERLASAIGADFHEIVPAAPYTPADLDWRDKQSRSSVEMADRASRPAIAGAAPDLSAYGTVFVGFPIWWYVAPTIINSFLEAYDFSGKTIILFATSGGSGMGDSTANLRALAPAARVLEGRRFRASVPAEDLKAWAERCR